MSKNLVIVESPAKAKTIRKYLGSDFEVLASYGHIRDLVPKSGAVDPNNNFAMRYEPIAKNKKHFDGIVKELKSAEALYLATDPDREGEAISWHLCEMLKNKKALKDKQVHRVAFYEITKKAIQAAINQPRDLAMDLVNAQQARRALDYLVGFNLSPLLWKKIRKGLSAGRVQSPALRMIVEREEEIENFNRREYWNIKADLAYDSHKFLAKLIKWENKKLKQFDIISGDAADKIKKQLLANSDGNLVVESIEKKNKKQNPSAPFTTSTLQQEAARKLGFTTKRTMRVAQQLYEGIDVGEGATGLITYMRTDSVNLSLDAISEIRDHITKTYSPKDLPDTPRLYKTKSKNAQEAHEAIRPTSVFRTPDSIKHALSDEQFRLYSLIYKRTVACQMIQALFDVVNIDFTCGQGSTLRSSGSVLKTPGFLKVYKESLDNPTENDDQDNLPSLKVGDKAQLLSINCEQKFTEPPPRYSEAALVKSLEEYGIGRPSTYAAIISTLQARNYVSLENKKFIPSDVGRIVNKFLTLHFTKYVDYNFTAKLEDNLDAVSRGEHEWIPLLKKFWGAFDKQINTINETVKKSDVTQEKLDEACPKCGEPLVTRLGPRGKFIGCSAFPKCDYLRNIGDDEKQSAEPEVINDRKCPKCNNDLVIKSGRYGKFIGCSNYPTCKHIEPLEKPKETNVGCPECNKGTILQRKSRYGKIFYSCSAYPKCKYALWYPPVAEKCPECGWPILIIKTTKKYGTQKACPQKECKFCIPFSQE